MVFKITGEEEFSVLSHSFGVSQSESGYTLNYSSDGLSWTQYGEATPANEDLFVNGVPYGSYFKLVGNTSEVQIIY